MKKIKSILLSVVLMLSVCVLGLFGLSARAETEGYYTYTVSNEEATITDCDTSISGDVTIPSTLGGCRVTSIGDYAFEGCAGLTSITIPNSITSIGACAFRDCDGLQKMVIPFIGNNAYDTNSACFGDIFEWADTYLEPDLPSSLKEVVVTNATTISSGAFSRCFPLESITLFDGVTSIGKGAFYACDNLTNITIPDSVTSIGDYAFGDCGSLQSVTIPDSVTSIGHSIFEYCGSLDKIKVPFIGKSLNDATNATLEYFFSDYAGYVKEVEITKATSIGDYAFAYCDGLTSITIPDSVTSIGNYAFYDCDNLTNITIPDSVTNVGIGAFNGTVWYNSHPDDIIYVGKVAYVCKGYPDVVSIKDGTVTIADYAFSSCDGLTSITIPNSVTSIGSRAFEGCTGLTSITIPDSVTTIADYAFSSCTGLTSINIPDSVTSIGNSAFYWCTGLTSINIPDSVTSIGSRAFYRCTGLTSITIPDSVTTIGESAFNETAILYGYKTCPAFIEYVSSHDNKVVYLDGTDEENIFSGKVGKINWSIDKRTGKLNINGSGNMIDFTTIAPPWYEYQEYITEIELFDGVANIGESAFSNCKRCTSITIPDSVTSIGDDAFYNCTGLTSVTIGNSVTSIGNSAFYRCTGLSSVTIGNNVTSIGDSAFYRCTGLSSVTIGNSVTSIGFDAFYYCTGLTSINIPDSVTSIGVSAFSGCTGLTSITIPYKVSYIDCYVFGGCNSLKNVYIYNKDCHFDSRCGLNYNQTIYGFVGSTAETFAEEIGAEFIDIMTVHSHNYDSACDAVCNNCGFIRAAEEHSFNTEGICAVCGALESTPGDIDGVDGVTDRDAVYLLYHTFLPNMYPVNQDCDFNSDGSVNDKDAIYLLYYTFLPGSYPLS